MAFCLISFVGVLVFGSLFICFPSNVDSAACAGLVNPHNCISLGGLAPEPEDECVARENVCDNTRDCPFGDDEWNCNDEEGVECTDANGYFECFNSTRSDYLPTSDDSNICLRREYSCLGGDPAWDCPNQEDLLPSVCQGYIQFPCHNASLDPFGIYYECSNNGVCIFRFELCDNFENCLNGEDESDAACQTNEPTNIPSNNPTHDPTNNPSNNPTNNPSNNPTNVPSNDPTRIPTSNPSNNPSNTPTPEPTPQIETTNGNTDAPTDYPTWFEPTNMPTNKPTRVPGTWWRVRLPTPKPTTRPTIWWSNYRGASTSGRT